MKMRIVIFEKFHDPGPVKKLKKFGNIKKNFFSRNNQKSLNSRSGQHFG